MINVVKRIDDLRKERGWTVYKLSVETGLTQQAIHAWNNKSVPSIATLEIICDAFGITMADFFTEKYTVEVTPQIKLLFDNWRTLTTEEQKLIDTLIKKLVCKK
jgi:transcriptional regulator with XRE-family HTH domain